MQLKISLSSAFKSLPHIQSDNIKRFISYFKDFHGEDFGRGRALIGIIFGNQHLAKGLSRNKISAFPCSTLTEQRRASCLNFCQGLPIESWPAFGLYCLHTFQLQVNIVAMQFIPLIECLFTPPELHASSFYCGQHALWFWMISVASNVVRKVSE